MEDALHTTPPAVRIRPAAPAAQRLFARAGFRRTMIEMTRELGGAAG